jgi:hypothetical protein
MVWLPVLYAACAAAVAPAAPDDYDRLGRLEREEVDGVLAAQGLALDRAPAGKRVRNIVVVTHPVFGERDGGFLRFFNIFHATTRPRAVVRELVFGSGDPWDQARIDESLRQLRDPRFHNVLVILPVVTGEEGTVDALVVIRDVWSLRLNSRYEVVGSTITSLSLSLSENNLFGLRKRAALVFAMDQGEMQVGPLYEDPNLVGSGLTLRSSARLVLAREGGAVEGTVSDTLFAYPFRSLRQQWSASLEVAHVVDVARSFVGTSLRTYDDPDTLAKEMVPWVYDERQLATEAQVLRSFGTDVIQRVGVGHDLTLNRPEVPADFAGDAMLQAAFRRDVLPPSELVSSVFAHWQLFTPVYAAVRDLATFDFREDYQLGPLLDVKVGEALEALGSDRNFTRFTASARWTSDWGGGLWRASASFDGRLVAGALQDRVQNVTLFAASPVLARLRLVAGLALDWYIDDTRNRFLTLGGSNGLRGYGINVLSGQARALGHVELRTLPLRIGFYRLGAIAFWDAGDAAASLGDVSLNHAVGAGLRSLIPQLDPLVIRLDWAFALDGASRGWPGRISLGVEQVF